MGETEYTVSRGSKCHHRVWNSAPLLIAGERVYDLRRLAGWVELVVAAAAKCWLWWVLNCTTVIEERAQALRRGGQ